MSIDRSVVVPLDADETFALLSEPARLRRWQAHPLDGTVPIGRNELPTERAADLGPDAGCRAA
jgi:hypothetical protein